jgi:hypothetical protein
MTTRELRLRGGCEAQTLKAVAVTINCFRTGSPLGREGGDRAAKVLIEGQSCKNPSRRVRQDVAKARYTNIMRDRPLKIFAGTAGKPFAEDVCRRLGSACRLR